MEPRLMPPISMQKNNGTGTRLQDSGGDLVDCSPTPQRYTRESHETIQEGKDSRNFFRPHIRHEPVAMKANSLAVIPLKWGATILGISAPCPTSLQHGSRGVSCLPPSLLDSRRRRNSSLNVSDRKEFHETRPGARFSELPPVSRHSQQPTADVQLGKLGNRLFLTT